MTLAGRTVVLTRPRGRSAALAALLHAHGAEVLDFPAITFVPADETPGLRAALARLDAHDWIAFTSAIAVDAFADRCARTRARPAAHTRIAAVGPATAAALRGRGFAIDAMPEVSTGAAIAAALGPLDGRSVLLPRAAEGRPETIAALEGAGAHVEVLPLYRTVPATADASLLDLVRTRADALTFTSPSTVHGFRVMTGRDAPRLLAGLPVACIGPTTADAARAAGVVAPLCAAHATPEGLIAILAAHFATVSDAAGSAA